MYIGIELEVNFPNEIDKVDISSKLLNSYNDKIIIKEEVATTNEFEIVTIPLEYTSHYLLWEKIIDLLIDQKAYIDPNRLGMHLHINRNGCKNIDAIEETILDEKNKEGLLLLSGRKVESIYANFEKYKSSRYVAFNKEPINTCEIRFFGSTLNTNEILRRIEFVKFLMTINKKLTLQEIAIEINNRNK